jgi:hypothetical protein
MTKFKTTESHWDCECVVSYIHDKNVSIRCDKCGACEQDSPDSRVDEVQEGTHVRK